jgi:septal ring-binding cell division protein DamX
MAKEKKHRKKRVRKQSLAKNVALLLISIAVLAGASILFSTLNTRPEYSYDPIEKNLNKLVSKVPGKTAVQAEKPEPQEGSAGSFEYSYWDILLLQDKEGAAAVDSFSIQIGSFKTREAADQFASEIGDKTHLRCTVEGRGKSFVVRWGTFHTKEMADRYCSTLSGKLQKECFVMKL